MNKLIPFVPSVESLESREVPSGLRMAYAPRPGHVGHVGHAHPTRQMADIIYTGGDPALSRDGALRLLVGNGGLPPLRNWR